MIFLRSAFAASLMLLAISCDYNKGKEISTTATVQDAKLQEITLAAPSEPGTERENQVQNGQQKDQQQRSPVNTSNTSQNWDKKIIKNATLNIEVEDYQKYNKLIHELTAKWEAYISAEQENTSDYKIENALTIKIPVQYFDEAVQHLSLQSGKLLVKQITAQDVSAEYFDTRTRMEAKKRVRLRYLDMLNKAKNMEEVLQVEREINNIQEQVEAGEGRINYLSHSAAYSTIQLTFFQVLNATASDKSDPGFGKRILIAFSDGLKWISELLIIIITLWPLWIGIIAGIWTVKKNNNS